MNGLTMIIRHICFSGPNKKPAYLEFGPGLNLVYGPSNTGKSSVLDAIDFMLGRERGLDEIPEHVGYDRLFLGISFYNQVDVTLVRSLVGGNYQCFEGLHFAIPEGIEAVILKVGKPTKKIGTLSNYILKKIGFENKKLKKNAKNETDRLTLRTLLPLWFVTETEIQKKGSPFRSVQYTKKTFERSRLRLLLTGVDDGSLISSAVKEKKELSRTVKIELLGELISDQYEKMAPFIESENIFEGLMAQNDRLDLSLDKEKGYLQLVEDNYIQALAARNAARGVLEKSTKRLSEINEMLARFQLLDVRSRVFIDFFLEQI